VSEPAREPVVTFAWKDEGGESWAELGGLLLVLWAEWGNDWNFQVQQGEKVLAEWGGCKTLEEASLAASMWALGYLYGTGQPDVAVLAGLAPAPEEAEPAPPAPFQVVGEFGGEGGGA
jgi:hypothetical protein